MQDIDFRSYAEFMDYLPIHERDMVDQLNHLIQSCIPRIKRKLSYNVPFYSQKKTLCYIWPGSIPWGKKTFEGVQFGFTKGHLLQDENAYLEAGSRKYVRIRQYNSLSEEDLDILRDFLFQAEGLDRM